MKNVDVLITIEHVDRELDAATCVALVLERCFDLRVEIRNFYTDFPALVSHKVPAVLATPFFYFKGHSPMREYLDQWPRAKVFNFAWEQILYKMNQSIKVPSDPVARRDVWHLCWTPEYRDFLVDRGVDPAKLVLTGNPVMKFYDPPYREYFTSRHDLAARHGLDASRKWLLFPENYRWGFLSDSQVENFVKLGGDRAEVLEARAYCQRSLTEVMRWLKRLCDESDVLVLLRPRPATSVRQMECFARDAVGALPHNLRVIKEESAREWILAADHVVSSYSTTLIEAALARKPVHLVSPEPLPGALEDDWYRLLPWIEDEAAMVKLGQDIEQMETGAALGDWARQRLLGQGDPLRNIAAAIAALHPRYGDEPIEAVRARAQSGGTATYRQPFGTLLQDLWRQPLMRRGAYHRYLARRFPGYAFSLDKHEKDIFGARDVTSRMRRWNAVIDPARPPSR